MGAQSIHRQLSRLLAGFFASAFILLVFILFLSNTIFWGLNQLLNQQNLYSNYRILAENLQNQVTNFLYQPGEISAEELNEEAEEILKVSQEITEMFPSAQMFDHQNLNEAYVDAVRVFLNSETPQDLLAAYQNAQHLYEITVTQYDTTITDVQEIMYRQMENFSSYWHNFERMVIFAFLAVLLIIGVDIRKLIRGIVYPIEKLTEHAGYISNGDYGKTEQLTETVFPSLELKKLSESFVHMSRTIQKQLRELQESMTTQVMLSKTEVSLMQSLINPHFLFNCLSMLSGLAIVEKAPTVHDYAVQLAQFLRESLNYVGKQVSLKEEFQYIQHYIDIQKLRFRDRISFLIECPQECETAVIPAIILQPLVENALVHGVGSYLQEGQIRIWASCQKNRIILGVEDNGMGIPEAELQALEEKLYQPFEIGKKGTGLPSVVYRLRYFFQEDVQVQLESDKTHTCVKIEIPRREQC